MRLRMLGARFAAVPSPEPLRRRLAGGLDWRPRLLADSLW